MQDKVNYLRVIVIHIQEPRYLDDLEWRPEVHYCGGVKIDYGTRYRIQKGPILFIYQLACRTLYVGLEIYVVIIFAVSHLHTRRRLHWVAHLI